MKNNPPTTPISKEPAWVWGIVIFGVVVLVSLFSSSLTSPESTQKDVVAQQESEESLSPESSEAVEPEAQEEAQETKQAEPETSAATSAASQPAAKPQTITETAPETQVTYEVVKVVDGDTIKVNIDGTTETLRLIGLDSPETVDPRKPVQCFGKEASTRMSELVSGKRVRLDADSSQGERDKYNRLLRYVYLEDGTDVIKVMIAGGYAHEYTYNIPYKYQEAYKAAEKEAREQQRGLWADDACESTEEASSSSSSSTPAPAPVADDSSNCDPNYTPCIPKYPPDLNCKDIDQTVTVIGSDPHGLDRDKDGLGCE